MSLYSYFARQCLIVKLILSLPFILRVYFQTSFTQTFLKFFGTIGTCYILVFDCKSNTIENMWHERFRMQFWVYWSKTSKQLLDSGGPLVLAEYVHRDNVYSGQRKVVQQKANKVRAAALYVLCMANTSSSAIFHTTEEWTRANFCTSEYFLQSRRNTYYFPPAFFIPLLTAAVAVLFTVPLSCCPPKKPEKIKSPRV